ncbi:MAG: hypothetical protein RLY40_132 [Pseudomonadota bacterium]|jgi:hypothetical protein
MIQQSINLIFWVVRCFRNDQAYSMIIAMERKRLLIYGEE